MRFVAEFFDMDSENNCHLIQPNADCKSYMCSAFENKEKTGPAASIVVNALGQVGRVSETPGSQVRLLPLTASEVHGRQLYGR